MNWQLKEQAPQKFIDDFPEYSPVVLQLLYHRGFKTQEAIDEFFNPDYEGDLHDPFLMLGVAEAVKRLQQAIKKQEKIAIFGDYDTDGVCGAVILKAVLEELDADLSGGIFIPNRLKEGYGLNSEAIKKMAKKDVKLLLTVDCGISDLAAIELANSLDMEVIITDHHQPGHKLPPARVIINPWQSKDKYPFKELCGAGVVFKLAQALMKDNEKIKPGWEKWLLDLVALATVADCVPLLGENRTLVRYGLVVLAQTQRVGLQELMKIARLSPIYESETLRTNLDTCSIGFVLAPRLNAAGRIEHADLALDLLITRDRARAQEMAKQINDFNRQRQKITDSIALEIEKRLKDNPPDKECPAIIESDKTWSPGIIGLVAGKVADRYHRPTIIFSSVNCQGSHFRGSARSVPGFNIVEAIDHCSDLLEKFGGHAGAAGLELAEENLKAFKEKFNQVVRRALREKDLSPVLEVDMAVQPSDINWELFDNLERLEPFGEGNERPLWLLKDMAITSLRVVGNGSKHLKLGLKNESLPIKTFRAIGFGLACLAKNGVDGGACKNGGGELKIGDKIDIVFELLADEWNGTRNLQMKIIDIHNAM